MPETWYPPQGGHPENLTMFPNNFHNIVYDAKATLTSGAPNMMQQPLLHHPGMGMQIPGQNIINPNQLNKKDPAKSTVSSINIKGEEDEQNNNSKLPVKVPVNGDNQTPVQTTQPTPQNGPIDTVEKNKVRNRQILNSKNLQG